MSYDDAAPYDDEKTPLCPTCYRRKALETPAKWDRDLLQFVCPLCESFV